MISDITTSPVVSDAMTDRTRHSIRTITQDWGACHEALAFDETPPALLKTLDLSDYVTSLQKK